MIEEGGGEGGRDKKGENTTQRRENSRKGKLRVIFSFALSLSGVSSFALFCFVLGCFVVLICIVYFCVWLVFVLDFRFGFVLVVLFVVRFVYHFPGVFSLG